MPSGSDKTAHRLKYKSIYISTTADR
ncbi:hypothetical protein E2C01_076033 [Portunus trituberculatus]|uniref:Uncharacterized protein n=1 Tax=Portunus trituberculatus TaxID=210409 RepID=A0A5B7IIP1_PORTR|nr:hypothetical protein [Portunus trituberculatus]